MKDTVQLHVNVKRELWKALKLVAIDRGDTLAGVVVKALEAEVAEVWGVATAKGGATPLPTTKETP